MLHALTQGFWWMVGALLAIAAAVGLTLGVIALLVALFADRG